MIEDKRKIRIVGLILLAMGIANLTIGLTTLPNATEFVAGMFLFITTFEIAIGGVLLF